MFNIVLFEPEIPQNTGNAARTCACTGSVLHLIKPLGFDVSESAVKRAGLDYWDKLTVKQYENFGDFLSKNEDARLFFFTKKASLFYTEAKYSDGDFLVFGKETTGLPNSILSAYKNSLFRIPMVKELRCLNLSNSVALCLYEALRQTGFDGLC